MVKVGNQGLDERYICLWSHRISHPVVLGLRQSHSITFSTRFPRLVSVYEEVMAKNKEQIITNATNLKDKVNTIV